MLKLVQAVNRSSTLKLVASNQNENPGQSEQHAGCAARSLRKRGVRCEASLSVKPTLPTASTIPMARVAMATQRICLGDVMFVSFILFVSVPAQQERYRINTDGADALPPTYK